MQYHGHDHGIGGGDAHLSQREKDGRLERTDIGGNHRYQRRERRRRQHQRDRRKGARNSECHVYGGNASRLEHFDPECRRYGY